MKELARREREKSFAASELRVAGYHVVRTLGAGERAIVYLGQSVVADSRRSAALKVYRPSASNESIETELIALERVSHPHVLHVRDLSTAPDGRPSLVLEPLHRGGLARLLAVRSRLEPGEVVTILAPIAAALGALHDGGVCHGALGVGAVLFRASGAPVIAKLGHASLHEPGSAPIARRANPALIADVRGFAALAAEVLSRVGPEAKRMTTWVSEERETGALEYFVEQFESRIFELGAATAVQWRADHDVSSVAVPGRVHAVHHALAPQRNDAKAPLSSIGAGAGAGVGLGARAQHLAARARSAVVGAFAAKGVGARVEALGKRIPRRRPLIVAGITAAVAFTLLLVLIPSTKTPLATSTVGTESTPSPVPPETTSSPTLADDPVAAFEQLARVRAQCIRDLSVLCLDAVVQDGSAAFDDDVALILALTRGESPLTVRPGAVSAVHQIERYGDAALVGWTTAENEPASALLVKGEAGWRIRDYVAA